MGVYCYPQFRCDQEWLLILIISEISHDRHNLINSLETIIVLEIYQNPFPWDVA